MRRKLNITIVDYGAGNLLSVCRALHHLGANTHVTHCRKDVAQADRLLLPGVGAFGNGMQQLHKTGLVSAISEFQNTSRPFMGICLGMQLMLDSSVEFGDHQGLGIIHGKVINIPKQNELGTEQKTPRIGWYKLEFGKKHTAMNNEPPILRNIKSGQYVYFVHSYHADLKNEEQVVSVSPYNGQYLNAIIKRDNMIGCQFHPEKSGEVGLAILNNFLSL